MIPSPDWCSQAGVEWTLPFTEVHNSNHSLCWGSRHQINYTYLCRIATILSIRFNNIKLYCLTWNWFISVYFNIRFVTFSISLVVVTTTIYNTHALNVYIIHFLWHSQFLFGSVLCNHTWTTRICPVVSKINCLNTGIECRFRYLRVSIWPPAAASERHRYSVICIFCISVWMSLVS